MNFNHFLKFFIFALLLITLSACGSAGDDGANDTNIDSDADGVLNTNDAFPYDATETTDTDSDGIGDNSDPDIDNDSALNASDAFPYDASETADTDSDGVGDNTDPDIDDDGVLNADDAFPYDATETTDTDSDGVGDNTDPDIDDDGVLNADDAFPYDATETTDTDGDGIGDNTDPDIDNDGFLNASDAFPYDARQTTDTDSDGFGDNAEYFLGSDPNDALSIPQVPTWATYQGGAKHTGFMPLLLDYNDFSLRWSVSPLAGQQLHPVVAANNKVFVSNNTYYGDQSVAALNAVDGSQVWLNSYGSINSIDPPAYDNGKVYFQTGGHEDSYLRAVDANTGALVFSSIYGNQWSRYYAPTPYGGNIYINGGYYGGAYGFNGTSGDQLWFTGLSQYDSWTPAVDLQNVYAYTGGNTSASLSVIDRTTGSVSYTIADLGYSWSGYSMNLAPVLGSNNNVLTINSGRLLNFDLQNQAIGWEQLGNYTGQPSLGLGHIYTVSGGALKVVDEITGNFVWTWEPPASGSISSNIIVTMNHVFVSDTVATYAIDINTRATVWSYPASGQLTLSNEGALYIASQNGTLTAINISGDGDNDGMPGWWENSYGLDDADATDAALDADIDGLTNLEEYNNFTNPNIDDTDSDAITDGDEVNVYLTSPVQADTDGDGLDDGVEILTHLTSPLLQDTDSDGFDDNTEINQYGTDPLDALSVPVAITSYNESFEGGAIPAAWVAAATSTSNWTIDSSRASDGTISLRSGVITHNQNSGIEYTALFAAGTLSYSAWIDAESCCDKLEFYVDGVIVHNTSANGGWASYQTTLTFGEHTLEWRYKKDGSVNTGADAVWIDNIAFIN